MPRGDGTGPAGMGPMTGRAAGYCAGYPVPGYMNPAPGYGAYGTGWGRGRGYRNWYYATGLPGWARAARGYPAYGGYVNPAISYPYAPQLTAKQEMDMLNQEAEYLREQLDAIQNQIETLKKADVDKKKK
jgi:hypothetical protein